jgi:hypothetical protein
MEALQAELLALKQATGARLKRAPPPLGPFPLAVAWRVEAPPDAALLDADHLDLTATLPCLGCGRAGVRLALGGVPPRVAAAAAAALGEAWVGEGGGGGPSTSLLGLARLPALASSLFVRLITSLPDCVEAYETVDATGGTVRRRAIIDTDAPATVVEARRAPPPPKPALSPGEAELAFLARRFKAAFVLEDGDGGDDARHAFTLTVTPTDPAWTLGPVTLGGVLAPSYPAADGLSLSARAPRGPATAALSKRLEGRVAGIAGRVDGLRALVKEVENRASELGALSEDEEEDGRANQRRPPPSSSVGAPPTTLRLVDLRLDGVDALTPSTLTLQAACSACGDPGLLAQLDFTAGGDRAVAVSPVCKACGGRATLEAAPRIAHAGGNAIARIRAEGCRPLDLVAPTVLSAQCGRCEDGLAGLRLTVGEIARRKCPACFGEVAASYQGVAFEEVEVGLGVATATAPGGQAAGRAAAGAAAGPPAASRRPAQAAPLTRGTPLPALGTCRHYPHSHRWLRFPCCGRTHPCDLCHEVASPECPASWAKRQVCGFCSTEQSTAGGDGKCGACGKRLTSSSSAGTNAGAATSRFWEGGQGCRDRSRLDPRDPRRFAGLAKTKSKKAYRVGVDGAASRKEKEKDKE